MDFALNNLQELTAIKPNQTKPNQTKPNLHIKTKKPRINRINFENGDNIL